MLPLKKNFVKICKSLGTGTGTFQFKLKSLDNYCMQKRLKGKIAF